MQCHARMVDEAAEEFQMIEAGDHGARKRDVIFDARTARKSSTTRDSASSSGTYAAVADTLLVADGSHGHAQVMPTSLPCDGCRYARRRLDIEVDQPWRAVWSSIWSSKARPY
jgi:hypothetical protein